MTETTRSPTLWAFAILCAPAIIWLRIWQLIFNKRFELTMEPRR